MLQRYQFQRLPSERMYYWTKHTELLMKIIFCMANVGNSSFFIGWNHGSSVDGYQAKHFPFSFRNAHSARVCPWLSRKEFLQWRPQAVGRTALYLSKIHRSNNASKNGWPSFLIGCTLHCLATTPWLISPSINPMRERSSLLSAWPFSARVPSYLGLKKG